MRVAIVCLLVAGCSEPPYVAKPLPPLVVPKQPAELTPIVVASLGFAAGEQLTYMVRVRGFTLGSATFTATDTTITSHFATSMLAQAFAKVEHDLTTTIAGGRPLTGQERLELDGKARQFTTDYANSTSHSIHSAIGAVRTWAKLGATAGFMNVVVADKVVRVELAEPSGGKNWLRVDGKLVGLDTPASFTCWLDDAHVITRIEIRADGEQVTADLVH